MPEVGDKQHTRFPRPVAPGGRSYLTGTHTRHARRKDIAVGSPRVAFQRAAKSGLAGIFLEGPSRAPAPTP